MDNLNVMISCNWPQVIMIIQGIMISNTDTHEVHLLNSLNMTTEVCVSNVQCFPPQWVTYWLPDPRRWSCFGVLALTFSKSTLGMICHYLIILFSLSLLQLSFLWLVHPLSHAPSSLLSCHLGAPSVGGILCTYSSLLRCIAGVLSCLVFGRGCGALVCPWVSWSFCFDWFCGVPLISSLSLLMLWSPVLGFARMTPAWIDSLAGADCFLVSVIFRLCSSVHQIYSSDFSIRFWVRSCRILVLSPTSLWVHFLM